MKLKTLLLFAVTLLCAITQPASAQWSGETELGSNGRGGSFFSQYVFYDTKGANVLTRYFWVNGVLRRGEFSVGPTFHLKNDTVLKLQFGATTERSIQTAGTLSAKPFNHDIFYIADGKLSAIGRSNEFYQKLFVAINTKGSWQFRIEDLIVGHEQIFLRIGGEYRRFLPRQTHLYAAPFYDPIIHSFGAQVGFRFF